MRRTPPAITTLPPSPDEERQGRMLRYAIAMGVRIVCIGLCLVVPGWWVVVPLLGAVFLPYFAVLLANASMSQGSAVERPGGVVARIVEPERDDAA